MNRSSRLGTGSYLYGVAEKIFSTVSPLFASAVQIARGSEQTVQRRQPLPQFCAVLILHQAADGVPPVLLGLLHLQQREPADPVRWVVEHPVGVGH